MCNKGFRILNETWEDGMTIWQGYKKIQQDLTSLLHAYELCTSGHCKSAFVLFGKTALALWALLFSMKAEAGKHLQEADRLNLWRAITSEENHLSHQWLKTPCTLKVMDIHQLMDRSIDNMGSCLLNMIQPFISKMSRCQSTDNNTQFIQSF